MPINYKRARISFGEGGSSDPSQDPVRVLVYGNAKTRKTWWGGTAAETHNVYLLNGDRNTGILRNIPEEYRDNIHLIPVALDANPKSTSFLKFLTLLFEEQQFFYCYETSNKIEISKMRDDKIYLVCDLSKLSKRDLLLADSWTALVKDVSHEYMIDHNINAWAGSMASNTSNNKYAYYQYSGILLDNLLSGINKLPCHVMLTAHQDEYEKEFKENNITKKKTVTQVLSSSGNQAAKLPAVFGDTLWFTHNNDSTKTIIDSTPNKNRAGGGARLRPDKFEFPGWTWKNFCEETDINIKDNHLKDDDFPAMCLLTGAEIKELSGDTTTDDKTLKA